MDGKFGKAPAEDDTTILLETEVKLGIYDVLYQKWRWDGIVAESIYSTRRTYKISEKKKLSTR